MVREVRAAGPLMAALRAPVTARGPWLTAVLNAGAAHRFTGRPVAVVVEAHRQGRPDAAAFLHLRRRGPATVVTLLGAGTAPVPAGSPPFRLLARDDEMAGLLAAGIHDLLRSLRRPRELRLAGLPLGDPTARQLAARLPDGVIGTARTQRLVDDLDDLGPVTRSRDPRVLDRWLPTRLRLGPLAPVAVQPAVLGVRRHGLEVLLRDLRRGVRGDPPAHPRLEGRGVDPAGLGRHRVEARADRVELRADVGEGAEVRDAQALRRPSRAGRPRDACQASTSMSGGGVGARTGPPSIRTPATSPA